MARIRTVKPEFWGSAKTAKVSRDARLLFLGLLNLADDEGRLLASTKAIDGAIYLHDKDVTVADIVGWLQELEQARFVRLYTVDSIGYCQVIGFSEHQKVSHPTPSKFPPPSDDEPPEPLVNGSGDAPESLRPEVEQGTGNREQGGAPAPPPSERLREPGTWVERLDPTGPVAIRAETTSVLDLAAAITADPLTPSDRSTLRPVIEEALRCGYRSDALASAVATAAFRTKNGVMGELRRAKQKPTSVGNRAVSAAESWISEESA